METSRKRKNPMGKENRGNWILNKSEGKMLDVWKTDKSVFWSLESKVGWYVRVS